MEKPEESWLDEDGQTIPSVMENRLQKEKAPFYDLGKVGTQHS